MELVLPKKAVRKTPVCVLFAATGDQGFTWRREVVALPLAKKGIGSLILQSPFYGRRRPDYQKSFYVSDVKDLWIMAAATIAEGLCLLNWLEEEGFGSLGVSGVSYGGYIAGVVAAHFKKPIAVIPCLAAHSATTWMLDGTMRQAIHWKKLRREWKEKENFYHFLEQLFRLGDITNFPPPTKSSAAVVIAGRFDAFTLRASVKRLHAHWPGSRLQWISTGHVGAFLFRKKLFQKGIEEAFRRL